MAKANDAADAIRTFARQYKQLVEVAEVLDQLGSADGHLKELQAQVEDAKKEAIKAKDDAKKAKDKLADVEAKASEMIKAAEDAAKDAVKASELKAADIERVAQDKAAAMVAQASMEVSRMSSANADNIAKARAELTDINGQRNAAAAQAEAKAKELADIEKALEKARAKIAQLIA